MQLILLAVAMMAGGYARTAMSPLQETMRIALSLSDTQMAVLQGPAIGLPVALASIPLGMASDRYSRTRLLVALLALSIAGSALTAWASSFDVLLAARAVAGLAALGLIPIVYSLIADYFPADRRGRATTVVSIGQVVGNSGAFALGGALLALGDWRWAMLWLSVPLLLMTLAMLALREPPRSGRAIVNPSLARVWSELQQYRSLIGALAAGILLAETGVGAILIWAAPLLARRFVLPPEHTGTIMAVGMLVSGILGPIVGGLIADWCQRAGGPPRTAVALSVLALLAVPASLFALVPGVMSASILLIVALTIMLAIVVMGMTMFTIVIPNELRGLCISALVAANIVSSLAIAPVIVSLVAELMGGSSAIGDALSAVCVVASILAAAAFFFARRSFGTVA